MSPSLIAQSLIGEGVRGLARRGIGIYPTEEHYVYAAIGVEWDDTFYEGDGHDPIDSNQVTKDALRLERNIQRIFSQAGFTSLSDEGHDSHGDLLVRMYFTTGTKAEKLVRVYADEDPIQDAELVGGFGGTWADLERGIGAHAGYFLFYIMLDASDAYKAYRERWYRE